LTAEEISYERAFQCARIEESGHQLRRVQAAAAILKSKLKAVTERQEFLMSELRKMAAELLCKRLPSPRVHVAHLLASKLQFLSWAGMKGDMRAESERVMTRLNNLADQAPTEASNFWQNRTRAYALVVLQDRVKQVRDFVDSCRSALELVYRSMFPLNDAPQGLGGLMQKFCNGNAIKSFVREQLVVGATAALACARVHCPGIDLVVIGQGVPLQPDGEVKLMAPHYDAATGPAEQLVNILESETDLLLERLDSPL
jgi:hypothetical protein